MKGVFTCRSSPVAETSTGASVMRRQGYYAFGAYRDVGGDEVITDHKFTGQKLDGSGLMFYNARYYDPTIGQFVSPDTLVPDLLRVDSYNRYMYTYGNPLNHTDSSGHCIDGVTTIVCVMAVAALVGGTANMAGNVGVQVYENWDSERSTLENLTDVNGTEAAIAFGFGAAGGTLAPIPGGTFAVVATNAGLGMMQEVTTDMIVDGESLSEAIDSETAVAGALGGLGGVFQKAIPKEFVTKGVAGWGNVFEWPTTPSISVSTEFATDNAGKLMRQQLQTIFSVRFFTGASIGNVPVPEDSCGWRCPVQSLQNRWNGSDSDAP